MRCKCLVNSIIFSVASFFSFGMNTLVHAESLNLSNLPLFLNPSFQVPGNLLFIVDDSGSMDWEVMTRDYNDDGRFTGSQPDGSNPSSAGSVKHRDGNHDGIPDCAFGANGQDFNGYLYGVEFESNTYDDDGLDCNTADDEAWRFRNSDFNPLYFDPNKLYKPWKGLDAGGQPFGDMPITAAKDNPYDPNSPTIDLTTHTSNWFGDTTREVGDGFRYYTWQDLDGDSYFDNGEETEHLIKDADAQTQQNFANWFSYHRSREYAAKAAYGEIIAGLDNIRAGVVTLHNNNSANTSIQQMNPDPESGNKRALLDKLYSIHSADGTPLRNTLSNAGKYLACDSNSLFADCPALSVAAGGACQQNFMVAMTDGFYNGSFSISNKDGDDNSDWDGGAYADTYNNTLGDIAMHYYERDLHTNLDDHVPILPGVDEARHQHVVTYTVAFGIDGTLTANPSDPTSSFTWPDPTLGRKQKIDDLRHAAYNGRGEFLNVKEPNKLADALRDALESIEARTSSAASVALNSGSYNSDSQLYQARFNTGGWTGQLLAFPIDDKGLVQASVWDAGVALNTLNWDTGRTIFTYNDATRTGIPFRWNDLSMNMQALLHLDADGVVDNRGIDRLEYLRGRRDQEGVGGLRVRNGVLGDLLNSDPRYAGAPMLPDELGSGYGSFRTAYANRTSMIYVGGNDGMLHGFQASNGQEKLAYVPRAIFDSLNQLTSPSYQHRFYVDGSPNVSDAYGKFGESRCGAGVPSCWRSILISGLRSGGQALFALDVTDPALFQEANAAKLALWEFTDAVDADLGYTFTRPSIVRMANDRWAAVFGNGYNNTDPDGNPSTTGHAALYILFLDGGLDGTWTPNTDYIKFVLTQDSATVANPNGLASPAAIDDDGDFNIDYIYAGDLFGQLWKFDVTDADPNNWQAASAPFFTAMDQAGNRQPITTQPEVGRHPLGGVIVYFGTGKYLESADHSITGGPQAFYGVADKPGTPMGLTPGDLEQPARQVENVFGGNKRVTTLVEKRDDCYQSHGWYLELPEAGEKQVTDSILRNGRIIFTTLIPSTVPCSFGGTSWLMELDAVCGSRLDVSPFDLDNDHEFTDQDKVDEKIISGILSPEGIAPSPSVLFAKTKEFKYTSGSTGGIFMTIENPGDNARGRLSWQQFQ